MFMSGRTKQNRVLARPATMLAPAPQHAARSVFPLPERMPSHTSRTIRYVFLNGSKNIPESYTLESAGTHRSYKGSVSSCPKVKHNPRTATDGYPPLPTNPSTFFTFPTHLKKQAKSSEEFIASKERLPVFRQLCIADVPAMALGDTYLQNSSEELKEVPDTEACSEDMKYGRMRQAAECSRCDEA